MRLHLSLTRNNSIVPFDHIPTLAGALHKWLGPKNPWHHKVSLYSFSWLMGGTRHQSGLSFAGGARWFISSFDEQFLKTMISGIQKDPTINYGLAVRSITIQEDPTFSTRQSFLVAGPVLIKRRLGDRIRHFVYTDEESDQLLTETLITKLKSAGLDSEGVRVAFDRSYTSSKTKLVSYNGIQNRASLCPIMVEGAPEQIAFAWNVGAGNSTGIGFGALN